MSRLRFVPIALGALALASSGVAAQQAPIPKPFASFKCTYNWCAETPRTSPNGKFIARGGPTALTMFDVARGTSWVLSEGEAENVIWSPRGDMVAFGRDSDDGNTYVWSLPLDPATGKARGPAQRISVGPGAASAISPDSRSIVYQAEDSVGVNEVVVPATGGPVRVLVAGKGTGEGFWSADGKSMYAVEWGKGTTGDIRKIRLDGTADQLIYEKGGTIAGMTADHRYLILVPVIYTRERSTQAEQGTVIDTTGRVVGHFPLPVGEKQFDRVLGDTAIVWLTSTDRRMIEIRPVAGGAAKRLPLMGESDDVPRWSPDGKHIAFQVHDASRRTVIAVANADGSNPKVFSNAAAFQGGGWSPDSRFLALPNPDRHQFSILDVASGALRTVPVDTALIGGNFRWREDGKSFVIVKGVVGKAMFYEFTLAGRLTKLSEWPRSPRASGNFIGNTEWFVRSDSAASIRPINGGPVRALAAVPAGTTISGPAVSPDTRWIAAILFVPKRTGNSQVELFSTATGARTVLDLPFASYGNLAILPDNKALIAIGSSLHSPFDFAGGKADTVLKLYRVPLDGTSPRVIGEVGMIYRWQGLIPTVIVSPDGKSIVYTVQPETSTQTLGLISLRGAIPAATARPPQD